MADGKTPESDATAIAAFDMAVRDTAYFLWEQDGKPEGKADEHWQRALEQHVRARAYAIWLREGRPDDRDAEIWFRAQEQPKGPSDRF